MPNNLYEVETYCIVKRSYRIEAPSLEVAVETATKNQPDEEQVVDEEITSVTKITAR